MVKTFVRANGFAFGPPEPPSKISLDSTVIYHGLRASGVACRNWRGALWTTWGPLDICCNFNAL